MATQSTGPAVLVCEDREDVSGAVSEFFASYDLTSVAASDTHEAERLLRAYSSSIRLAIVDMSIYRDARAGYSFVLQQTNHYPKVRFVLMTAHDLSAAELKALAENAIGFYRKPFDLVELLELAGVEETGDRDFSSAVDYQNPTADELFSVVVTMQTRERHLLRRWRRHAEGLVNQILSTEHSPEGPVFINGRRYGVGDLIQEINNCTPLGERLVELHYRLVDKLLLKTGR